MTIGIMTTFILFCSGVQHPTGQYYHYIDTKRAKCIKELTRCYDKNPTHDSVALDCIQDLLGK